MTKLRITDIAGPQRKGAGRPYNVIAPAHQIMIAFFIHRGKKGVPVFSPVRGFVKTRVVAEQENFTRRADEPGNVIEGVHVHIVVE
ncbi:MAG TPA: hypothetical protein VG754_10665, partial [Verrucomicrobiae bacterium]|nr:hypothetical protein [Verrucomicrobiae bacterium]